MATTKGHAHQHAQPPKGCAHQHAQLPSGRAHPNMALVTCLISQHIIKTNLVYRTSETFNVSKINFTHSNFCSFCWTLKLFLYSM